MRFGNKKNKERYMKHAIFSKKGVIGSALPFLRIIYTFMLFLCAVFCLSYNTVYAAPSGFRITFTTYMQGKGYTDWVGDDTDLSQDGSYPTALKAIIYNLPKEAKGSVRYQASYDGSTWSDWAVDGERMGDPSSNKKFKAIKLELQGAISSTYDVYFKILSQGEWSKWYKDGEAAVASDHIDGINLSVRTKGKPEPGKKMDLSDVDVSGIDPSKPMVALTFDDGPNAEATNRILDSLQAVGGKATFFVVGTRLTGKNLEALKRAASSGMEIGNHTYAHAYLTKQTKEERLQAMKSVNDIVYENTGQRVRNFRPPGGLYNDEILGEIESFDMAVALWAIDTLDWKHQNPEKTTVSILDNIKDGDIVLMHDLFVPTATAAEKVIPELHKRGFQLVTMAQLAKLRGGLETGKVYNSFRK
jgi:hypothetical protein